VNNILTEKRNFHEFGFDIYHHSTSTLTMQPTPPEKSLESIIKYFSLMYVLLITSGLLYNIIFYKNYGIIITEYIDLSEGLLLFMPTLTTKFMICFAFTAPILLVARNIYLKNFEKAEMAIENKSFMRNVIKAFFICLVCTLIFYIISLYYPEVIRVSLFFLLIGIIMFGTCILDFALIFLKKEKMVSLSKISIDIIFVFTIFLVFTFWGYWTKIDQINRKRNQAYFEIVFNDSPTFYSNTNVYYLGRTKNYLFIYNFPEKKTSVYNVGDIKKFTVTENESKD
jgi:hypothetical protein